MSRLKGADLGVSVGISSRGAWAAGTSYVTNDIVTWAGQTLKANKGTGPVTTAKPVLTGQADGQMGAGSQNPLAAYTGSSQGQIVVPTTANVGDLALLATYIGGSATLTTPSGWTAYGGPWTPRSPSGYVCQVFYKVLVAADIGTTITLSTPTAGVSGRAHLRTYASAGVDPGASSVNSNYNNTGAGPYGVPAVTTTVANDLLVIFTSPFSSGTNWTTPPVTYAAPAQNVYNTPSNTPNDSTIFMISAAEVQLSTAQAYTSAAIGAQATNVMADGFGIIAIAIKPPAAAVPPPADWDVIAPKPAAVPGLAATLAPVYLGLINTATTFNVPEPAMSSVQKWLLTQGGAGLALPAPGAGKSLTIVLQQDATGRTFTGFTSAGGGTISWLGGAPTFVAAANRRDVFTFFSVDGTTWIGALLGKAVETVNTVAASGAAVTLPDVDTATMHRVTLTAATPAITLPPPGAGKSFTVELVQDATGGRAPTWVTPSGAIRWPGGTVPTITATANAIDVVTFICIGGVNWYGFVAGQAFS